MKADKRSHIDGADINRITVEFKYEKNIWKNYGSTDINRITVEFKSF